jgi:membrane glycosyltransferase
MFISSPAWIGMLIFGTIAVALAPTTADFMHAGAGHALLVLVFVMWFAPHFATEIDVLARPDLRRAFGGTPRFLAGIVVMTLFYILILPMMWFCHTLFMFGILLFGRAIGWAGQVRDDHTVTWAEAIKQLWPHAVLGFGIFALLAATHPSGIPYALLLAAGPALAVPIAVISAWPTVGRALTRLGIGCLPEETAPPAALTALALPALDKAEARPA